MSKRDGQNKLDLARQRMLTRDLQGRDITDPDILEVMAETPREAFVPPGHYSQAYADAPLPIGAGQTISQPYIVALMTQLLRLDKNVEVLEIGTGSGYQTAILSHLAGQVYTIETLDDLSVSAQAVLKKLGIDNVTFHIGDGSRGWPAERTFERIIVTAAVPDWPAPLVAQLAQGGSIVAPIGGQVNQSLILAEKRSGKLIERYVCGCRFVKLLGEHGFRQ